MKALLVTYTDMMLSLTLGNYRGRISLSKPLYIGIDRMCQVWKVDP